MPLAIADVALAMGPAGLVAILAGWITTEVGRQPWVVYGLLRTADAVTPHALAPVAFTLAIFIVVYFAVFGAGTVYGLRIIAKGPHADESDAPVPGGPGQPRTPSRCSMPLATKRASASVPPPAGNGTTIFTGRLG